MPDHAATVSDATASRVGAPKYDQAAFIHEALLKSLESNAENVPADFKEKSASVTLGQLGVEDMALDLLPMNILRDVGLSDDAMSRSGAGTRRGQARHFPSEAESNPLGKLSAETTFAQLEEAVTRYVTEHRLEASVEAKWKRNASTARGV